MTKTKGELLEIEAQKIRNCRQCKIGKIGKAVVGEGSPNSQIVFIGEAPGKQEAKEGRPFIGRSGQLLRSLIRQIGLDESEIYITSPVKYLPRRGTPSKQDIAHGRAHLFVQLSIINPKLIVLLGNVAIQGVLEKTIPVTTHHSEIIQKEGKKYFITFHPAAALRSTGKRNKMKEDFKKLKKII